MTVDQIWFRLCDLEVLKKDVGSRTENIGALGALGAVKTDKKGFAKGRAADGTPIKGKITGKSLAKRMAEKAEKERKAKRSK